MNAFNKYLNEVNCITDKPFVNIPSVSYIKSRIYIGFMSNSHSIKKPDRN